MIERLRDVLRSVETSRALSRGIKAFREGQIEVARTAVDEVVAATERGGSTSQRTHRLSVRLIAVTLRAEVAAKQGDAPVTRASIAEGFTLWEEARQHPANMGERSYEAFTSWERWARRWLEQNPDPAAR